MLTSLPFSSLANPFNGESRIVVLLITFIVVRHLGRKRRRRKRVQVRVAAAVNDFTMTNWGARHSGSNYEKVKNGRKNVDIASIGVYFAKSIHYSVQYKIYPLFNEVLEQI